MRSRNLAYAAILVVVLSVCLAVTLNASAQPLQITVNQDGSVTPATSPLMRNGNTYTLTGDLDGSIVVKTDNVVIDGAGHALQGRRVLGSQDTGYSYGVSMPEFFANQKLLGYSNVTVKNFKIDGFDFGVWFENGLKDTVVGNTITNTLRAVYLRGTSNYNLVANNTIENADYGIAFDPCTGNVISGNIISNATYGVSLYNAPNNALIGNSVVGSQYGIYLAVSQNVTLRNNILTGNAQNLYVRCEIGYYYGKPNYVHNIDSSNTVDGKPVYYWIGQHGKTVPSDAGFVALIDCSNITVQNLNLSNNGQGILLTATTNSTITGNVVSDAEEGIALQESPGNIVSRNIVSKSANGIYLYSSVGNLVFGNNATESVGAPDRSYGPTSGGYGIYLDSSNSSAIFGNSVTGCNGSGIYLSGSFSCDIYGNNVTDNGAGIYSPSTRSGGNVVRQNIVSRNRDFGVGFASYQGSNANPQVYGNIISNSSVGLALSGISVSGSDLGTGMMISNNTIANNTCGISFSVFYNAVLRNNSLIDNYQTFSYPDTVSYRQDVDASNTVNGKPVIYWINQHDRTVQSDAGFLALIGCTNVTASNLSLTKGHNGIFLLDTRNSSITGNIVENNDFGITEELDGQHGFRKYHKKQQLRN